jgi:AraC-like DNA-binding protein
MNKLVYRKGISEKLLLFPHMLEIGARKNSAIQLNAFSAGEACGLRIFHISEGKFEWMLGNKKLVLYPGDTIFILPGIYFGNEKNILEIGGFSWIHLDMKIDEQKKEAASWGRLLPQEKKTIAGILHLNRNDGIVKMDAGKIIREILAELNNEEAGFQCKVNLLIDSLLIALARNLTQQNSIKTDFTKIFMELEHLLRQDLSHQWTLEEMASKVGMGTTVFNEKVKNFSGFTPINYLINIRISEAMKMLKQPGKSVTDIALEIGFYSSQHFATTFKKLTGYTPSQFKKNH